MFRQQTIDEMVDDLSRGQPEQRLNLYFSGHYPINKIEGSIVHLMKKYIYINFDLLNKKLYSLLNSDISFLLTNFGIYHTNFWYFIWSDLEGQSDELKSPQRQRPSYSNDAIDPVRARSVGEYSPSPARD